jgi:hypothetical protein
MKVNILNRSWRASGQVSSGLRAAGAALTAVLLLAAPNLRAGVDNGVVVGSLCGGGYPPFYGYVEGNPITSTDAQFHNPVGLAQDSTGEYLFVADSFNNAIRVIDLYSSADYYFFTYTFAPIAGYTTGTITNPVGVALDASDNVYVLNRGNGNNGAVVVFDNYGDPLGTNSVALANANGITLDNAGNVYVTASNNLFRINFANGFTTSITTKIATVGNAGANLQGLVVMASGQIAACDSGRNGILLINPTSGVISNLTGFNGAGDNENIWDATPNNPVGKATAKFNQPMGLALAGNNILIVADYGNDRVKAVNSAGAVTNLYGVNPSLWYTGSGAWPGWRDGSVVVPDAVGDIEARLPNGVLFAQNGTVYVTEDYYQLIRKVTGTTLQPLPPPPPPPPGAPTILSVTVFTNNGQISLTWSAITGATSYNVKRSPSTNGPYTILANTTSTNYTDTSALAGTLYYYVVSALNAGGEGPNSAPVSATLPLPPVPDPAIGYVIFPATTTPYPYLSVFTAVSSFVANNDQVIVMEGAPGSQTFYTFGPTGGSIPDPTSASASAPVGYQDGLSQSEVAYYTIFQTAPAGCNGDLTIKAIGEKNDGSPPSAIVQARFQFITANPVITGDNAAQFTVSDITTNAELWYTIDGTDPTNAAPSVGPLTNGVTLSLNASSNLTFKVRAFRDNYQPSAIVPALFSATNFVPNSINFGFAAGEASSKFIGSPGQTFYAPVTLSPISDLIYSLQFNLTVTNAGPNPGPAVTPGQYFFQSFLVKPDPNNPGMYIIIPPAMFLTSATNPMPVVPPTNQVFQYNNGWFEPLTFSDSAINLLGVGWLERYGKTNLFITKSQTLIDYSMPHDTLFTADSGKVVLGGYAFQVPPSAVAGQTYQIQIGRPSATSDGVGAPGSAVYIATPTNGSLTAGAMNSIKIVTAGQIKYIAGDCAPFGWFNAGDFGDTNLDNSDVMQVFQSAIYGWNYPPPNSDFFDSMDSCGTLGVATAKGYWLPSGTTITNPATLNLLFNGNDTTINQMAFGDGVLDVCDVYVTFRRSLDPSLSWFQRFWTNGVLAAEPIAQPNVQSAVSSSDTPAQPQVAQVNMSFLTNPPSVNFAAADFLASAGQTVQVPITAQIFGTYPLRVVMLNLSVEPLDGSPALTSAVQFTPNAALGTPTMSSSSGNGNYAATWLDSTISGLTGTATLGTLTVAVPASASSSSAYAIHFDHASASPNGIASFPKQTLTGLITLSSRTNSYYNDGIPDSWRLRYFGTIYNVLSQATADADGDGANNWQEYIAGTDPTDPNSVLRASTDQAVAQTSQDCVIQWPSVAGRSYVIERSASLFPGSWTAIATNTGSGTTMQYHDTTGGKVRFYRVQVTP